MSQFDAARSPDPRSPAEDPHDGGEGLFRAEPADAPFRYPGQGRAAEQFVEGVPDHGYDEAPPRRRGGRGVSPWLVFVLLVIIAGLMFRLGLLSGGSVLDPSAVPRPVTPRGELAPAEQTVTEIYERVSPSVVHLVGTVPEYGVDSTGRRARIADRQVSGSGFVWNGEGHVVTNAHVIAGAEDLRVTLADGTTYNGRPVGALPGRDIAVLKIDAPPVALVPIPVGESGDLRVGQAAFAIGSPFGLDQTLTTGVVSGLDRAIPSGATGAEALGAGPQRITGAIQTDAAINVGNSGGPLLDSAGRLIGMNTAIFTDNGGRSGGIGFAVPVDDLNRFVPELIRTGEVRPVGIGVGLVIDAGMRRDVRMGRIPREGALVGRVLPGSTADRAGVLGTRFGENRTLPGDLIIAVDGRDIGSGSDLQDVLRRRKAGETVVLTILRAGQPEPLTLPVTLQELPEFESP
ncbi:S1C family serine protease [Alienimonas californiensis]|uniref:Serine protease HtrA n=1 Tax=Alienimonas californiensis TaxID=2527989 RepID=A0A517PEQ7_9PLAN|nr:trypsin-like peptidase domain-containing protein [Alienimonas californiensis]QDT17862.1 Putative serine protease HtrA [Alienimonas californiensis]